MGIDSMRVGGGRCPPLLVGGLLIACLMLICNWWTLSSENVELLKQIDELGEQIKISAEERDQCVTLRGNLEQRFKLSEGEIASLHVRLEQEAELKKKNDELEESLTMCKSELDSLKKLDTTKTATLEALRLENDSINITLKQIRADNKKLQDELAKVKEEYQEELSKVKLNCNASKKAVYIQPPLRNVKLENDTTNHKEDQENQDVENDLRMNDASNEEDNGIVQENDNMLVPESDRDQQMKATNEYSDRPDEPTK